MPHKRHHRTGPPITGRVQAGNERDSTDLIEPALTREPNPIKQFFKMLGPGLITGASDDDPSGIGTYAIAGASVGYATLWTAL